MAWTKAKTTIAVCAGLVFAAGTTTVAVKEVAAHKAEASWRNFNPNPDLAPFMVKILPTKFAGSQDDSMNVGRRGDNWIGVNEPAVQIARVAYTWRPGRIIFDAPRTKERYDFISTLPTGTSEVLREELKRKLGLVGRVESREMDVLVLKVRKPNAPGLRPPVSGQRDFINNGRYYCDNSPISSDTGWYPGIARFLEGYFGKPIVDRTGLSKNYNIDLKWEERFDGDPDHGALKKAMLDQLGLELVPARESIEVLVVEAAK